MDSKADQIYQILKSKFAVILAEHDLNLSEIKIRSQGLSPEEAIGITERRDYPILTGQEVMLQAECQGCFGQAFTDAPADFDGTLEEILAMDISVDPHARGLFIAAMNAVMRALGLVEHTVHCKNQEPKECAKEFAQTLKRDHPNAKIALIGYQPSIFEALAKEFPLRVLDLNPQHIGEERFGIIVEHGIQDYEEVVLNWADLILCTGSVFSNGTMGKYLDIGKEVIFFGISVAGAAYLLGLQRLCPMAK
ncbi:MAG: DUF364 domain-containing protein [Clostridiales bacterium]